VPRVESLPRDSPRLIEPTLAPSFGRSRSLGPAATRGSVLAPMGVFSSEASNMGALVIRTEIHHTIP
jgi:hypothetical protein